VSIQLISVALSARSAAASQPEVSLSLLRNVPENQLKVSINSPNKCARYARSAAASQPEVSLSRRRSVIESQPKMPLTQDKKYSIAESQPEVSSSLANKYC
jgi:hypothetical protein